MTQRWSDLFLFLLSMRVRLRTKEIILLRQLLDYLRICQRDARHQPTLVTPTTLHSITKTLYSITFLDRSVQDAQDPTTSLTCLCYQAQAPTHWPDTQPPTQQPQEPHRDPMKHPASHPHRLLQAGRRTCSAS